MRSLIAATVLMSMLLGATMATAVVDFTGMSGAAKKSVHPVTGNIHYEHDVHHVFSHGEGVNNTFFKATYRAEHEAHWHIIELHDHIESMKGVSCGKGHDDEINHLKIVSPSASLLEQLHKQRSTGYSHTIVTAAGHHKCEGKGIFRRLVTVVDSADSVSLLVRSASYNDIFKNLDLLIESNHVHQDGVPLLSGTPEAVAAKQEEEKKRAMSSQSLWGDVSGAASSAVSGASSVCSSAESDVKSAASTTGSDLTAAAGSIESHLTSFNVDQTHAFKGVNYNGDVTKSFSQQSAATETGTMAASFSFTPTATLKLVIDDFKLSNFETYFTGAMTGGITGNFAAQGAKTWTNRKLITTLYVDALTFTIGPVPVWLTPSFPIFAGFTATVQGSINVKAVLSASGSASLGYGYSPSTGHRLINTHDLKFVHDFGPLTYSVDVGIQAYVEPMIACTVESMAKLQVGITLQGNAIVQSNDNCEFNLNFAAQPTVALNAEIDASLMGHDILKKKFGPWTLYSTKIPLYNYCIPHSASTKKDLAGISGRVMETQNHKRIITTRETALSEHHIGKTWSGSSASLMAGGTEMISMEYGAQFSIGKKPGSSVLFMSLTKKQRVPGQNASYAGFITAVVTMEYESDEMPAVGKVQEYRLVANSTSTYHGASNSTVLDITPSETMTWKTDAEDIRHVQLVSPMFYGSVSMLAAAAKNSTNSFKIFADGGGVLKIDGLDFTPVTVISVLIYGGVATLLVIIFAVLTVVFYRKYRATARRSAIVTKEDIDGESGLIGNAIQTESQ